MEKSKMQLLIEDIKSGNRRAFARGISIIEDRRTGWEELLGEAYKNMNDNALIVGITGPGGAGKSTLINKLISEFRKEGKKVGVIAVDPSSPFSGGAVLGDRVRMSVHNTDLGVFIRSLGSRGCIGGISEGTKRVLYLFKNYDFDIIIVESVGQDETEITNFVDVTLVALVPGYGDSIQMAKAGIQEIGDIFVINKSDHPDTEIFTNQLKLSFGDLNSTKYPPIINTIASSGKGIPELMSAIEEIAPQKYEVREEKKHRRVQIEIETEIIEQLEDLIQTAVKKQVQEVLNSDNQITPYEAADNVIRELLRSN